MPKSKAQKRIEAQQRQVVYDNNFGVSESSKKIAEKALEKNINTRYHRSSNKVLTPHLVQRGLICDDFTDQMRLTEAIKMDYMGSSEFEYGAMPSSLRAMQLEQVYGQLEIVQDIHDLSGNPLIAYHTLPTGIMWSDYHQHLLLMREDKIRLKEPSYFDSDRRDSKFTHADWWWDIRNHVMWSFNSKLMARLPTLLVNSWKYMDDNAKNS